MKNVFVIVLIFGVLSGAVTARGLLQLFQQNMPATTTFGARNGTDTLIARVMVREPRRIGQVVMNTFTLTQAANPPLLITSITITEQRRNRGSTVAVTQGGVGTPTVTLQFTSQRGADINSLVEIFGAPQPMTTTVAAVTAVPAG